MTTVLNDHVLKLGWDASDVEKGHRRLNTMFARLNTSLGRMERGRTIEMRKQTAELQKQQRIMDRGAISSLARRPGMGGIAFPGLQNLSDRRFRMEGSIDKSSLRAESLLSSIPAGNNPTLQRFREQVQTTIARLGVLREGLQKATSNYDFIRLRNSLSQLNTEIGTAARGIGKMNRQLHMQDRIAMRLKGSMVSLAVGFASVFAVIRAGSAFFRVGSEMESMQASMLAASGSSKQAAEDFQFVTNAALKLGVDLQESAHGYTQLGAAARAAGFSADETKNVFMAVTEASRAYGLSAERTNLVFLGFQQMISKGKISMEELRRQIGEQIPGAFSIAAKAMGVTTGELDRMVSKGELMPEEFITPFANAIRLAVRESGALEASMKKVQAARNRFISMMQLGTKKGFEFNAGLFASSFEHLAILVKENMPLFKAFGLVMSSAFKVLVIVLDAVSFALKPIVTLAGALFDSMERATKVDIASSKLGTFDRILRRIRIALFELSIAWDEFMLNADATFSLDFKKSRELGRLFGQRKRGEISNEDYAKKLMSLTQTEATKLAAPTTSEYTNRLSSLSSAGVAGQNKNITVTDNSTNNFTLVGNPQENQRMLDTWWQDKLTLASGVAP